MGEIKTKELTLSELQKKVYTLEQDVRSKQSEIEGLNLKIKRYSILSVADELTVHKSYKDTMCTMLIKRKGGNVCKLYGTTHSRIKNTSLFAKQITLLPRLLKIVSRLVEGEYAYTLQEEAEDILYEASSESIDWVGLSPSKSFNHAYVLKSKKKEVEA